MIFANKKPITVNTGFKNSTIIIQSEFIWKIDGKHGLIFDKNSVCDNGDPKSNVVASR